MPKFNVITDREVGKLIKRSLKLLAAANLLSIDIQLIGAEEATSKPKARKPRKPKAEKAPKPVKVDKPPKTDPLTT